MRDYEFTIRELGSELGRLGSRSRQCHSDSRSSNSSTNFNTNQLKKHFMIKSETVNSKSMPKRRWLVTSVAFLITIAATVLVSFDYVVPKFVKEGISRITSNQASYDPLRGFWMPCKYRHQQMNRSLRLNELYLSLQ